MVLMMTGMMMVLVMVMVKFSEAIKMILLRIIIVVSLAARTNHATGWETLIG